MATQVVDPTASEWVVASTHRTPGISIKRLFQRDGEGRSFEFNVVRFDGELWSPRHRHNFDQIRIGLEGQTDYGPYHQLPARTIGYYPEGTYYGPLTVKEPPSLQAILQFDGASRLGYVNYIHLDKATEELKSEGEFRKGFFHPNSGGKAIDGYQASWERATGREMVYPEPRYAEAVYLHIDAFPWRPVEGSTARVKHLATFSERNLSISVAGVPAGVTLTVGDPNTTTVGLVISGTLRSNGVDCATYAGVLAEEGEQLTVTGVADDSELVFIDLPRFDD
jgi:hypothetical protein